MVGARARVGVGGRGTGSWDLVKMEAQICKMNEFWRRMVMVA